MGRKTVLCPVALLLLALLFAGCGFSSKPLEKAGYIPDKLTVTIDGVKGDYNLLLLADLHMIADTEEVSDDQIENVTGRRDSLFGNSAALWRELPGILDKCGADYLLFAGDMIDFNSQANIDALKEGLNSLQTSYVYVRGDHDEQPYFMADTDVNKAVLRQNGVYQNGGAYYVEFDEFVILAWNNSTEQLSEEGTVAVREAYAIGKPIILLTHVPLDSFSDATIRDTSAAAKGGKYLVWSYTGDCYYYPDSNTRVILDLIYFQEDSLIREVVCGHLHLGWDGYITDNTHQHVFSPAFGRYVGVIEIKGK